MTDDVRLALAPRLSTRSLALFTDIDGTISPIAPTPAAARVDPACRAALERLARRLPLVAAVSGRPAAEAAAMVGVDGIVYAGNHGLELLGAPRVHLPDSPLGPVAAAATEAVAAALRRLDPPAVPGLLIEPKGPVAALHYRLAPDPDAARILLLTAAQQAIAGLPLRIAEGRMVIELRPAAAAAHKGTVVQRLLHSTGPGAALYLGDDVTDLDAFHALHGWAQQTGNTGYALGVLSSEAPPAIAEAADYTLQGVAEVAEFLTWLADQVG